MTPRPTRHPYLLAERTIAFAHRGGTEAGPENSLAAFEGATALGFTHLETDVHLSSDGVVVALHDERLDRVTDMAGAVAEMPWAEVSRALIGGTEPIPTLEELLEAFPEARFNIDAKSDEVVPALAEILVRRAELERVCLGCFSNARMRLLRELLPGACFSASPREVSRLVAAAKLPGSGRQRAAADYHCLQVPVRHKGVEVVTAGFVAAAHARGAQVHVWTIDDPSEMTRLLDLGVDGIMTDRPSVLRDVLAGRGEWPGS